MKMKVVKPLFFFACPFDALLWPDPSRVEHTKITFTELCLESICMT